MSDDMYDFGGCCAKTYVEHCSCGKKTEVSTQGNESGAEYTTYIYVKCDCGKSVHFSLPVN